MTEQETALIVSVFGRLLNDAEGYTRIVGERLTVDCHASLDPLEVTVLEHLFPSLKSATEP